MASCSRRLEGDVKELRWSLAVLQLISDDAERQGLYTRHRLVTVGAVAHDAGQAWHFGEPPSVIFTLQFHGERHGRTVTLVLRPNNPALDLVASDIASPRAFGLTPG
jgi:hypothetical protein